VRSSLDRAVRLLLLSALLIPGGCDLGSQPNPEPTTIVVTPGSITFDALQETRTLNARVLDRNGDEMANVQVSWSSQNAGVADVSAAGIVTSRGNGATSLSATAGSASRSIPTFVQQLPTELTVMGGDGQEGAAGQVLPEPIRLRIEDRLGEPVEGAGVAFAVLLGGGTIAPSPAMTDAGGIATATWTLGAVAGTPQSALVSVIGAAHLFVELHAVARTGNAAALIKESGDGQSAPRSSALPEDLAVRLQDALGNPVGGVPVQFEVAGGGGSVDPQVRMTGADGTASTRWTLGPELGAQTVVVTSSGVAPVEFSAIAFEVPGSLTPQTSTNQSATVGQAVPSPPAVRLLDGSGAPIPSAPITFEVEAGGGTIEDAAGSVVVVTDADGIARIDAWILGATAGENTLRASVTSQISVLFSATGIAGPAAALVKVSGDGQVAPPGSPLPFPTVVRVTDALATRFLRSRSISHRIPAPGARPPRRS
jgi:hypothetical protein